MGKATVMPKDIEIEKALQLPKAIFVDVRSPKEYAEATIPGAVNLPLFSDEERAEIGTIYRMEGPRQAKKRGLEIVAPRLPQMVAEVEKLREQYENIVIFCWRGGLRSYSVAVVLDVMGVPVYRLLGGYKAYRRHVLSLLENLQLPYELVVIHGLTGSGKTRVIKKLAERGMAALDLEALAQNKGSVFGFIGMGSPPTQKMFDSLLLRELERYRGFPYLVVECESKRIGRVYLPDRFMEAMKRGKHILLYCPLEIRAKRLVEEYTAAGAESYRQINFALEQLRSRLGANKVQQLQEMVAKGELVPAAEILLRDYYDRLYRYPEGPAAGYDLCVESIDIDRAAEEIAAYLERVYGERRPPEEVGGNGTVRRETEGTPREEGAVLSGN